MRRFGDSTGEAIRPAILVIAASALGACGAAGGGAQNEENRAYERNWKVGDGREVEVRFEDGALALLDARPNEGWNFGTDVEDGRLEVQTRQELRDAEAGTYRLGDAGAVQVRQEGGGITLVQTQSTGEWSVDVVQQDGGDIEAQSDRQDEQWRLEAETEDGRLEVDTVHEVTEPVQG